MSIRLIATDLDGTLLRSDLSVSKRTRKALDAARAVGIYVVPVTARQPHSVISGKALFSDYALCGNGALCVHLDTGEVLFEAHLAAQVHQALASTLSAHVPGVVFASVREGGTRFLGGHGYAELASLGDHGREPAELGSYSLEEVTAQPSLKFIVRHASLTPRELLAEVRALNLTGFAATHSGAPFLEILAEGVSKAWGLARLCGRLGIDASEVLAFGDAPNDAEMLSWAGRSVAMANADPEALAAADEVTLSNDEDGVAAVLEDLLNLGG